MGDTGISSNQCSTVANHSVFDSCHFGNKKTTEKLTFPFFSMYLSVNTTLKQEIIYEYGLVIKLNKVLRKKRLESHSWLPPPRYCSHPISLLHAQLFFSQIIISQPLINNSFSSRCERTCKQYTLHNRTFLSEI